MVPGQQELTRLAASLFLPSLLVGAFTGTGNDAVSIMPIVTYGDQTKTLSLL